MSQSMLSHVQLQTCLLAESRSCSGANLLSVLCLLLCGTWHPAALEQRVPRSAATFRRAHSASACALLHAVCGHVREPIACRWEDPQDLASKARAYVDANWGAAHRLHHVHHA